MIGAILAFFSLQMALNSRLQLVMERARSRQVASAPEKEGGSRWDPRLFTMASFGQLPAATDWVWIQVLLDDRISHVAKGEHAAIFYDLDLISRVDPPFSDVYREGADLLAIVRNDIAGARELLERGDDFRKRALPSCPEELRREYWSREWQVPLYLGYLYLFELGDLPSASVAFREAAGIRGAPHYLTQLADELAAPGGQYQVGLRVLNLMIENAPDELTREELSRKRGSLLVAQYLDRLNRDFRSFLVMRRSIRREPASEGLLREFLKAGHLGKEDPWGGTLSLDAGGTIRTSTPHGKVFGLD